MSKNARTNNSSERRPSAEIAEAILLRWGVVESSINSAKRATRRTFPRAGIVLPFVQPDVDYLKPEVIPDIDQTVHTAEDRLIAVTNISPEQQARIDSAQIALKEAHGEAAA